MSPLRNFRHPFDYTDIDQQIEKFRQLALEYKKANMAYFGEYLSKILFDE